MNRIGGFTTGSSILAPVSGNAYGTAWLSQSKWWDNGTVNGSSASLVSLALTRIMDWAAQQSNGAEVIQDINLTMEANLIDLGAASKSLSFTAAAGKYIDLVDAAGGLAFKTYPGGEPGGTDDAAIRFSGLQFRPQTTVPYALKISPEGGDAATLPSVLVENIGVYSQAYNKYADKGIWLRDLKFPVVRDVLYKGGFYDAVNNTERDGWALVADSSFGQSPIRLTAERINAIDCNGRLLASGMEGVDVIRGEAVAVNYGEWISALRQTTAQLSSTVSGSATSIPVTNIDWFTIDIVLDNGNTHTAQVTAISGNTVTFSPALPSAAASGKNATLAKSITTTLSAGATGGATSVSLVNAAILAIAFDTGTLGTRHISHITALSGTTLTIAQATTVTSASGTYIWVGGKEPDVNINTHSNARIHNVYTENMIQVALTNTCKFYRNQNNVISGYKGVHINNSTSPGSQNQEATTLNGVYFNNLSTDINGRWIDIVGLTEPDISFCKFGGVQFLSTAIFRGAGVVRAKVKSCENLLGDGNVGNAIQGVGSLQLRDQGLPKTTATGAAVNCTVFPIAMNRVYTVWGDIQVRKSDLTSMLAVSDFHAVVQRGAGAASIVKYRFDSQTTGASITSGSTSLAMSIDGSNNLILTLTAASGETWILEGNFNLDENY